MLNQCDAILDRFRIYMFIISIEENSFCLICMSEIIYKLTIRSIIELDFRICSVAEWN